MFIDATLVLCKRTPEEIDEISNDLSNVLDMPEATPFLASLTALSDMGSVVTMLNTVRLHPEIPIITACVELTAMLMFFQRDQVSTPDFLSSLYQKSVELCQLAKVCASLLQNPANRMTGLCARLVTVLETIADSELLVFVGTVAGELLQRIPPDVVERLGLLLITASKDTTQVRNVKKLQGNWFQMREKLIILLNTQENLTIQAIEQLLSQPSQELVQVTQGCLRFLTARLILGVLQST